MPQDDPLVGQVEVMAKPPGRPRFWPVRVDDAPRASTQVHGQHPGPACWQHVVVHAVADVRDVLRRGADLARHPDEEGRVGLGDAPACRGRNPVDREGLHRKAIASSGWLVGHHGQSVAGRTKVPQSGKRIAVQVVLAEPPGQANDRLPWGLVLEAEARAGTTRRRRCADGGPR